MISKYVNIHLKVQKKDYFLYKYVCAELNIILAIY